MSRREDKFREEQQRAAQVKNMRRRTTIPKVEDVKAKAEGLPQQDDVDIPGVSIDGVVWEKEDFRRLSEIASKMMAGLTDSFARMGRSSGPFVSSMKEFEKYFFDQFETVKVDPGDNKKKRTTADLMKMVRERYGDAYAEDMFFGGFSDLVYETEEPEPVVTGVSDKHRFNVVFMEGDEDGNLSNVNSVGVDGDTVEEAWVVVEALIGDDDVPLTIVDGDEVIAYRPLRADGKLRHDHWRGQDEHIPEEYAGDESTAPSSVPPKPDHIPYVDQHVNITIVGSNTFDQTHAHQSAIDFINSARQERSGW